MMLLLIFLFLTLTFIECNVLNVNRLKSSSSSSSIDNIINNIKNNTNIDNNKIDINNNSSNYKNNVNLTLSAMTWNLAEKKIKAKDSAFIKNFKGSDIIVLGVQECENIKPRRNEGHRSKTWRKIQKSILGKQYDCLAQHKMGGLQIAVHVKRSIVKKIIGVQVLDVACGVGNVLTNKGAVCVLLRIKGKTLALINAHMAAHQGKVKERNDDYKRITKEITIKAQHRWLSKEARNNKLKASITKSISNDDNFFDQVFTAVGLPPDDVYKSKSTNKKIVQPIKGTKKSSKKLKKGFQSVSNNIEEVIDDSIKQSNVCPFDGIIFMGDFNYRVDLPRLEIEAFKEAIDRNKIDSNIAKEELFSLLEYDQLYKEKIAGNIFQGYEEGEITFLPTFKYDKGSDKFDTSPKARQPAWTDRILYAQSNNNNNNDDDDNNNESNYNMLVLNNYTSIDSRHSDHRPVFASFNVII